MALGTERAREHACPTRVAPPHTHTGFTHCWKLSWIELSRFTCGHENSVERLSVADGDAAFTDLLLQVNLLVVQRVVQREELLRLFVRGRN